MFSCAACGTRTLQARKAPSENLVGGLLFRAVLLVDPIDRRDVVDFMQGLEGRMAQLSIFSPGAILDLGGEYRPREDGIFPGELYRRRLRRNLLQQLAQLCRRFLCEACTDASDKDEAVVPARSQKQSADRAWYRGRLKADDNEGVAPHAFDFQPFRPLSGAIGPGSMLGYDAFQSEFAGDAEERLAIGIHLFGKADRADAASSGSSSRRRSRWGRWRRSRPSR